MRPRAFARAPGSGLRGCRESLGRLTMGALLVALAVLHGLLAGFLFSQVELPRFIGAAPIVLLAFAPRTLVGSILFVLLPKSFGLPSFAVAVEAAREQARGREDNS